MKYTIRVIDFETTGIPEEGIPHSVCEAAHVDIDAETKEIGAHWHDLVIPATPMDLGSRATHHLDPRDCETMGEEWPWVDAHLRRCNEGEEIIYAAHNADFEKKFFNPEGAKWIDTYKVALKLYPDAEGHRNQFLKYFLEVPDEPKHHPPHRALPDCFVTAEILLKMAESTRFNEMIQISKEPPYLTRIGFGKHRGEKFEDLPQDYLEWLLKQDMDEGVIAAAKRVLG